MASNGLTGFGFSVIHKMDIKPRLLSVGQYQRIRSFIAHSRGLPALQIAKTLGERYSIVLQVMQTTDYESYCTLALELGSLETPDDFGAINTPTRRRRARFGKRALIKSV